MTIIRTIDAPCNPRPYDVLSLDYEMADAVLGNLKEFNLRDILALGYATQRELTAFKADNGATK